MASISRSIRLMRSLIRRLSTSSFFSPGPRVPMPAPSRDSATPLPVSRGSRYSSWASSTWSLPSLLRARWAKMSRMSWVRSMTLAWIWSSRLRCWVGLRLWSKMTRSAPSSSFFGRAPPPCPRRRIIRGSLWGRCCRTLSTTRAPAAAASGPSSSRDSSASRSFVLAEGQMDQDRFFHGQAASCPRGRRPETAGSSGRSQMTPAIFRNQVICRLAK